MDSLNTLRAVLVGGAFVLTVLLAVDGRWLPALVLGAGILAHLALWGYLWKARRREHERIAALEGMAPPTRSS